MRRVVSISEIVGMDDGRPVVRSLYSFQFVEERDDGTIIGRFEPSLIEPRFRERLKFYSLTAEEKALMAKFDEPPAEETQTETDNIFGT